MLILAKVKEFVKAHSSDVVLVVGVILISLLSFAAGYIASSQQEKAQLYFEDRSE